MKKYNDTVMFLRIGHVITLVTYLCSLVFFGLAIYIMSVAPKVTSKAKTDDQAMILIIMGFFALIFVAFFAVYLFGLFTAGKRSKSNWVFQLVISALGITSMFAAIPYLLAIMKMTEPDVKKIFEDKSL